MEKSSSRRTCLSATMRAVLFLLFYLSGRVFSKEPDVSCLLLDLDYVLCSWTGPPELNYTFHSRFSSDEYVPCADYIVENGTVTGCQHPYEDLRAKRFKTFYTELERGSVSVEQRHFLKARVKLYPPTNLSVKNGSDYNLWFYWNQSYPECSESEVLYRSDDSDWQRSRLSVEKQSYCINLPSSASRYELRARSRVAQDCGASELWSDWSQTVSWGSVKLNNSTEPMGPSMSVWTPLLSLGGALTLLLLTMLLVHHDRIRILIPVVPNPTKQLDGILTHGNLEEWLSISKDLKEGFKAILDERACLVREFSHDPSHDPSRDPSRDPQAVSSEASAAMDQTDCSSSSSTLPHSSEGEQQATA